MATLGGTLHDFPIVSYDKAIKTAKAGRVTDMDSTIYRDTLEKMHEAEDAALDKLQRTSDELPQGKIVGALMRFQVADGYAYYVVSQESPLILLHVPWADGYKANPATIRGINKTYILNYLKQHNLFNELIMSHNKEVPRSHSNG